MKKTLLSMLMIASCFGVANAQLIVDENGHVAVGMDTTATVKSFLGVNTLGSSSIATYIKPKEKDEYGIFSLKIGDHPSSSSMILAAYGANTTVYPRHQNFGFFTRTYTSTPANSGRAYGVCGFAGNSTSGWNFGICGSLLGSQNGAGIYGTSVSDNKGVNVGGRYAGYFYGPVKVTGTLTANQVVTLSDYRVKENIQSLSNSSLDNIMSMNVVEYNYDADLLMPIDDSDTASIATRNLQLSAEKSRIASEKHYGLIAQELQQLYPDLVKESQDGYLTINYLEMVPLLIRSVQELKAEINTLQAGNAPIQKAQSRTTDATGIDAVVTALYQNTPNPFTESTVIRVDVAEGVTTADLYIYNMNGEQITEYPIIERGATSITIDGGSLNAGMYLYALIADGQVIDTKRMILTK